MASQGDEYLFEVGQAGLTSPCSTSAALPWQNQLAFETGGSFVSPCPGYTPFPDPLPPVTFTQSWAFTDQGFIAGGQNGAARSYTNPSGVASAPWSFTSPDQFGLRLSYENDYNCSGYNNYTQSGTATATIQSSVNLVMTVAWSGMGETQDPNYELMSLYVDGTLVGYAHAPGGQLGCAGGVAPVVSSPPPPQTVFLSANQNHLLVIDGTTNDQLYNTGAYYQFNLSFAQATSNSLVSTNGVGIVTQVELPATPAPRS